PSGWEGGARGKPRVRKPATRPHTEPLAEGGFVFRRIVVLLGLALAAALAGVALAGGTSTPKRIVSLSPTATEMLYAIGAGKQVVAVDDQSNYPASVPRTHLSGLKSSAEAI